MSKRLQVVLGDEEFKAVEEASRSEGLTVSAWVRSVLRRAYLGRPAADRDAKLAVLRQAVEHEFPTGDIDQMLAEIEAGYLG